MSTLSAEVRRNDPCPCGSGRRYKECHGAPGPVAAVVAGDATRHLLAQGRHEDAVRSARRAVELDPSNADAWTVLGLALETADPDAALGAWRKAVALAPQHAEAHFRSGDFHRLRGESNAAITAYEAALATGSTHPALLTNLGLALQQTGDFEQAERHYQRAIEQQPGLVEANANLADLLRLEHRYAEAASWYTRAAALNPNVVAIWLNLGACQHRTGALAAAQPSSKKRATMPRLFSFLAVVIFTAAAIAEPVTLTAADGVKVFAEIWRAGGAHAPIILAFHQAGSSHAEYAPLAPRLNAAGFTVLAIDQRSGGDYFGGTNQTVAVLGHSASYDAALPDLAAALAWGKAAAGGAPVLIWGSSYSAALVFRLAVQNPGAISGVLAFSPGEYLSRGDAVRMAARQVLVPVFITQASDRDEIETAKDILKSVAATDKTQFIPTKGGVHGSATLMADKNPAGAEENWQAVLRFLDRVTAPKKAAR